MRSLSAALTALLLLFSLDAKAQTSLSKLADAVVYIEIRDSSGQRKEHGSGFLIGGDGYVITALHLLDKYVEGSDTIQISLKSRHTPSFRARKLDCTTPLLDICLLYVSSQVISAANIGTKFKLTCSMPTLGEGVMAAGYPVGDDNSIMVVPGIVSGVGLGELLKVVISNNIIPGMSGGPIFNQSNQVIGLVWGKDDKLGISMLTPLMHGRNLLGMANIDCPSVTTSSSTKTGDDFAVIVEKLSTGVKLPSQIVKVDPATIQATVDAAQKSIDLAVRDAQQKPSAIGSVFVQVSNPSQIPSAKTAVATLKANGIKTASGIEVVESSPNKGQIRYFSDADRPAAERVQSLLGSSDFSVTRVTLPNRNVSGVVEVWFPKI